MNRLCLSFFAIILVACQFGTTWALNDTQKAELLSIIEKNCLASQSEMVYKASYSALKRLKGSSIETAQAVIPPACQLNFSRWKVRTTMLLGHGAIEAGASIKAVQSLVPIVLKNKVIARHRFAKLGKQWQLFYVSGLPASEIAPIFKQALASKYKIDAIEALGFAYLFYRTEGEEPENALASAHKLVGKVKRERINEDKIAEIISDLCQGQESEFCQNTNSETFPWRKSKGLVTSPEKS